MTLLPVVYITIVPSIEQLIALVTEAGLTNIIITKQKVTLFHQGTK
jgi:hypothetical protein